MTKIFTYEIYTNNEGKDIKKNNKNILIYRGKNINNNQETITVYTWQQILQSSSKIYDKSKKKNK